MADHYFRHKTQPNVARIMDPDTHYVSGTVGIQPLTFVASEWVDEGIASFAAAQAEVTKIFVEARKPDLKKDQRAHAKRLYDAVIAAGNSVEVAKQVSGY